MLLKNNVINTTMQARDWLLLSILSVLWGGSFFFMAVALRELPPLTIIAVRVSGAAIVLWGLCLISAQPILRSLRSWRALLIMGILNTALPFSFIIWGQQYIASGLASILNATTPIFAVLIAGVFLSDERITTAKLAGVLCGFAGVIVLMGPAAISGFNTNILAQLSILGAASCYGFAGTYGRKIKGIGLAPLPAATGQLTMAALILLPLAWLLESPALAISAASITVWAVLAALTLLSTALAYIIYFRVLATSGATNVLLVTFLVPVTSIVLGSFILGENLSIEHFIGMGIIGMGLALIDGRLFSKLRQLQPLRSNKS